jgi:hypothetical protein
VLQNVKQFCQAAYTVRCEKWRASRRHFHNNFISEKHWILMTVLPIELMNDNFWSWMSFFTFTVGTFPHQPSTYWTCKWICFWWKRRFVRCYSITLLEVFIAAPCVWYFDIMVVPPPHITNRDSTSHWVAHNKYVIPYVNWRPMTLLMCPMAKTWHKGWLKWLTDWFTQFATLVLTAFLYRGFIIEIFRW